MKYSYLFFSILILIFTLGLFYFPFIVFVYIFLALFFIKNKSLLTFQMLIFSIAYALITLYIDPMGENIGDIVTYYKSYNDGDYNQLILEVKFFRYILFNFLDYFSLKAQLYSFICVFNISFIYLWVTVRFSKLFEIDISTIKYKFFLYVSFFSSFPIIILFGYENILAICVFYLALYYNVIGKKKSSFFLFLISILIHISLSLFVCLFYFSNIKRFSKVINACMGLGISILLFFLSSINIEGIPVISVLTSKFYFYINGDWSYYIGKIEYLLLALTFVKLCFLSYYSWLFKDKRIMKIINFSLLIIPSLFFFLCSRTLTLRYGYLGTVFIIPFMFYVIFNFKTAKLLRQISVLYLFVLFLFPYNLYMSFYLKSMTNSELYYYNIYKLVNHNMNNYSGLRITDGSNRDIK